MPGMLGVDRKSDLEGMKEIFSNQHYRPDLLKIYPCMVMPGTVLYDMYKEKKYKEKNKERNVPTRHVISTIYVCVISNT